MNHAPMIKPPSYFTYRIAPSFLNDEERFRDLVEELEKNRAGFESLMLFTAVTHSVVSLDVMRPRCDVLKKRIAELKSHGWEVGIDLLCTVGFFKEFAEAIPTGFTNYTTINGTVDEGTFCPNHEKYRAEYLAPLLRMLVATEPDFVWLDDDTCKPACWCEVCMGLFNKANGSRYTREELRAAFNTGTWEQQLRVRQAHMDFETETNRSLLSFVEKTVHELDCKIGIGTMTYNDRLNTAPLADAMSGSTDCQVMWRPGGGSWNDQSMDDFLLRKGGNLGSECAWLPDRVDRIQAEVESFNYQPLLKSVHATTMECCVYAATGCNGIAYNIFDGLQSLDAYKPLMGALTKVRPFLDRIIESNGRVRPSGIYTGWTPRRNAARGLEGDWTDGKMWEDTNANDFFTAETATRGAQIFVAGLPPAYRLSEAQVTMLCSDTAWSLTDEELTEILSKGLYCDVKTLQILERRGFEKLTGFRAVKTFERDVRERLLPHAFNADGAGSIRDGRQSFIKGYAGWQLECIDGKGEALAELIDYNEAVVASCSMGAYENELGGRVVVGGYFATRHLLFRSKVEQLKRIFRWLSHDTLTAYVESFHRIGLWVRTPEKSDVVITLVNASMDRAENVELLVLGAATKADILGMDGDRFQVVGEPQGAGYVKFVIPALASWRVYSLRVS